MQNQSFMFYIRCGNEHNKTQIFTEHDGNMEIIYGCNQHQIKNQDYITSYIVNRDGYFTFNSIDNRYI